MSVDPDRAIGAEVAASPSSWDEDDVILYHLGLGAGSPPTDANELQYTYEKHLKVLPSFGVIPVFDAMVAGFSADGISINPTMVLHGEQDLEIHASIPTAAEVTNAGKIVGVYDKGKAALIVLETVTTVDGGDKLFTNRFSVFARGEGGFGGEPGPRPGNHPPDRDPDISVESPVIPQQGLIYRLSGDKNALHADPEFAKLGGFDAPILHGLCTFGVVCKAVVDSMLDGRTELVRRYQVRFAGVVYPGETLVTSMWQEKDKIILTTMAKERGAAVLTNAAVTAKS